MIEIYRLLSHWINFNMFVLYYFCLWNIANYTRIYVCNVHYPSQCVQWLYFRMPCLLLCMCIWICICISVYLADTLWAITYVYHMAGACLKLEFTVNKLNNMHTYIYYVMSVEYSKEPPNRVRLMTCEFSNTSKNPSWMWIAFMLTSCWNRETTHWIIFHPFHLKWMVPGGIWLIPHTSLRNACAA